MPFMGRRQSRALRPTMPGAGAPTDCHQVGTSPSTERLLEEAPARVPRQFAPVPVDAPVRETSSGGTYGTPPANDPV